MLLYGKITPMFIDSNLAELLSNFFLDIAKAIFIASFITTPILYSLEGFIYVVIKGISGTIIFLYFSNEFARIKDIL